MEREMCIFLSRNENRAVYVEMVNEKITFELRNILEAMKLDEEELPNHRKGEIGGPHRSEAIKKLNKWSTQQHCFLYTAVVGFAEGREAVLQWLCMPNHFRTLSLYKLATFNEFTTPHGGVSIFIILTVKIRKTHLII